MPLVVDELDAKLGLDRVHCLHVNDSAAPQGSNRDRHADLGTGEMGKAGLPFPLRAHRLRAIETGKSDDAEHDRIEVKTAKRLRRAAGSDAVVGGVRPQAFAAPL